MSSVHRRPRSPYWHGAFVDSTGRRRLRCTKEKDRSAAAVVAERWQREADILAGRAGPSVVPAEKAPELMERFVTLAQKAQAGELTAEDGQAMVNALLVATGQDPLRRESARAFFHAYLADKVSTRAAATARRYRSMSDRFLAHLGPRADQPLRTVTANDVRAFRDAELATGLNRATVNLGLVFVRSVLEQAKREGVLSANIAEAVTNLDAEHAERRAFTLPEVSQMLSVASEDWQTAIHLAIYAGFRLSDATGLRWNQFDAERGIIIHRPKKESRARAVVKKETVCPTPLADWLRARQKVGTVPITPTLYGRPTNRKLGLSAEFNQLLANANIPRIFMGEGSRRVADVGFHALRHTAASLLANAGVAEDVRLDHMGQSSRVNKAYTHREAEATRNALRAMPSLLPSKRKPA
jgi:integrase